MKNTQSKKITSFVYITLILFFCNNCSDPVSFEEIREYTLGAAEIEEVITNLPPGEVGIKRPLSELDGNPILYEIFKCPDSEGVVICHFPKNVEAQVTQCVGLAAISSHHSHVREYIKDDETRTAFDYLGPCRFPL